MTRASERIATSSAAKKQKADDVVRPEEPVLPEPLPKSQSKRKQPIKAAEKGSDAPPIVRLSRIAKARQHLQDVLVLEANRNDVSEDNSDEQESSQSPPQKSKKQRVNRKVRRSNAPDEGQPKPAALVLKLFDRSVDLGKFITGSGNGDIPLYPICREWMRNGRESTELSHLTEQKDNDKMPGIHRLPNPIPLSADQLSRGLDPRIPANTSKPDTSAEEIDSAINSIDAEDVPQLLQRSLQRWRQVRVDWKDAGRENELRYKHSCDVLKSMFEKSSSAQSDLLEPKIEPLDTSY